MILFPATQVTALLRSTLMKDILIPIKELVPDSAYENIIKTLGVKLQWNDLVLTQSIFLDIPTPFNLHSFPYRYIYK